MAKHNGQKISVSGLKKEMQNRRLYLNEHHLTGGSYQDETAFLDGVLVDAVTDDSILLDAMDGVQISSNFAADDSVLWVGLQSPAAPDLLTGGIPSTVPLHSPTNALSEVPFLLQGGYDGGIEVGFSGTWNPLKFSDIIETLEDAKNRACSDSEDGSRSLGGVLL